jgi:hypothetical protein
MGEFEEIRSQWISCRGGQINEHCWRWIIRSGFAGVRSSSTTKNNRVLRDGLWAFRDNGKKECRIPMKTTVKEEGCHDSRWKRKLDWMSLSHWFSFKFTAFVPIDSTSYSFHYQGRTF